MGSIMLEEILKSCGLNVIVGTFTPIQIKGTLLNVREISSNVLLLGIKNPVGICGRHTGHLGQILYIKSANISYFGILSASPQVSPVAHPGVDDTLQDLDYGGDKENTENEDSGSKYEDASLADR